MVALLADLGKEQANSVGDIHVLRLCDLRVAWKHVLYCYCMLFELAVRSQQGGTGVGHNVVALMADLGKEQVNSAGDIHVLSLCDLYVAWDHVLYCSSMLFELAVRSQQGGTGVGHNVVALLADFLGRCQQVWDHMPANTKWER